MGPPGGGRPQPLTAAGALRMGPRRLPKGRGELPVKGDMELGGSMQR